jgi:hypothetical protein
MLVKEAEAEEETEESSVRVGISSTCLAPYSALSLSAARAIVRFLQESFYRESAHILFCGGHPT